MTVDRQKVLDAFAAYIRPYDAQDPKVSLKIHHTYRVAALCEQIGRSIALEGTALDLAWLCGMLHDVGRFEQLRRFGTFDDSKSIDHARAGVQVFPVPRGARATQALKFAVWAAIACRCWSMAFRSQRLIVS